MPNRKGTGKPTDTVDITGCEKMSRALNAPPGDLGKLERAKDLLIGAPECAAFAVASTVYDAVATSPTGEGIKKIARRNLEP